MAPSQKTLEVAVALSLALAGGGFFAASLRLPGSGDPGVPGPGAAPGILGAALFLLGVTLAVAAARGPSAPLVLGRQPPLALLLMAVCALALEPVGFVATAALFLFGGFILLGGVAPLPAAIAALAGTSAAYLAFTRLLGVGLPAGRLVEFLFG